MKFITSILARGSQRQQAHRLRAARRAPNNAKRKSNQKMGTPQSSSSMIFDYSSANAFSSLWTHSTARRTPDSLQSSYIASASAWMWERRLPFWRVCTAAWLSMRIKQLWPCTWPRNAWTTRYAALNSRHVELLRVAWPSHSQCTTSSWPSTTLDKKNGHLDYA